MQTFQAKFQDGLILATINGQHWIVDTGAPVSFSERSELTLDGTRFEIASSYIGMSLRDVCDQLGLKADGILGMDVLSQFDVRFDMPRSEISLSIVRLVPTSRMIEVGSALGVPILFVMLNATEYRLLLDSGAEIGYLFRIASLGCGRPVFLRICCLCTACSKPPRTL